MDNLSKKCLDIFSNSQDESGTNDHLKELLFKCYSYTAKGKLNVNTIAVKKLLTELNFYKNSKHSKLSYDFYHKGILYQYLSGDEVVKALLSILNKYDDNCKKDDSSEFHKLNIELNKHIKKETHVVGILNECDLKEYRDSKNEVRIFFKNKIVVLLNKNGVIKTEFETYNDFAKLNKFVNPKKIIPFEINSLDENFKDSVINKILKLVTNDEKHFTALKSFIGFLISTHKNLKDPIVFILSDENSLLYNDAHGQSIKSSIILESIFKTVRSYGFENGRNFNKNFPTQNIRPEHDVFNFGDIGKNFPIDIFYEFKKGIDVEVKGKAKDDSFIPFVYAPKIILDTNYRIGSSKSSDKGRIYRMTINNHFDADYTPYDEFKHELFTDWNKREWSKFYCFMISCVSTYLENDLIRYSNPRLESLEFLNATSKKFVEFVNESLELEKWYILGEVAEYVCDSKHSKVKASLITKKWLKNYCDNKNLVFDTETGSGNRSRFMISEPNLLKTC